MSSSTGTNEPSISGQCQVPQNSNRVSQIVTSIRSNCFSAYRPLRTSQSKRNIERVKSEFNDITIQNMLRDKVQDKMQKFKKKTSQLDIKEVLQRNPNLIETLNVQESISNTQTYSNQTARRGESSPYLINMKLDFQRNMSTLNELKNAPLSLSKRKVERAEQTLDNNQEMKLKIGLYESKLLKDYPTQKFARGISSQKELDSVQFSLEGKNYSKFTGMTAALMERALSKAQTQEDFKNY